MATAPRQQQPTPAPQRPQHRGTPAFDFDPTRPFRQLWNFTAGTIGGALNGMAVWGSRGATLGGITGFFVGLANPVMVVAGQTVGIGVVGGVLGLGLVGALGAIALGGAFGALTGGFTRAGRLQARDDARAAMRNRGHGYQVPQNNIDRIADNNFDRLLQQNQELDTYWRDHVGSQGQGHGRGL